MLGVRGARGVNDQHVWCQQISSSLHVTALHGACEDAPQRHHRPVQCDLPCAPTAAGKHARAWPCSHAGGQLGGPCAARQHEQRTDSSGQGPALLMNCVRLQDPARGYIGGVVVW
jgi:hypothetical protein